MNYTASGPDVQPVERKRGRAGAWAPPAWASAKPVHREVDRTGWDEMGWEGGDRIRGDGILNSCWLADSWPPAPWKRPGATNSKDCVYWNSFVWKSNKTHDKVNLTHL